MNGIFRFAAGLLAKESAKFVYDCLVFGRLAQQPANRPGRRLPAVPVGSRRRAGVYDQQHDPLNETETDLTAEARAGRECFQRFQNASHPEVVRHAAVDEVGEGAVLAVLEILHLTVTLVSAPGTFILVKSGGFLGTFFFR